MKNTLFIYLFFCVMCKRELFNVHMNYLLLRGISTGKRTKITVP